MRLKVIFLLFWLSISSVNAELPTLRVGVLKFGTVNWELNTLKHHALDIKNGFRLEVVGLGSKNATAVALQSGSVDMIVTDFVWVARQRGNGRHYTFFPYSTALGSVMARQDSGLRQLDNLEGSTLGIAGGPVDKSWLLLRAYYRSRYARDLDNVLTPRFAAPPLLNKLIERGELPVVLNFWHYSARLEAQGMQEVIPIQEVVSALGIDTPVALIGWVFSDNWARENRDMVSAFLAASQAAKQILKMSDAEWLRLRPETRADTDNMLMKLREAYRTGIPTSFNNNTRLEMARLYQILAQEGGEDLVGKVIKLPEGTFWPDDDF